MPATFWIEEYRRKAQLADAVAQTGRGTHFDCAAFLYVVKQAIELLQLQPEHHLLDVGCANGLLAIPLSALCKKLTAVDPVEDQVARARENLKGCANARVHVAHAADLSLPDNCVDRVLMMGILQLIPPAELPLVFAEMRRVLRPDGRIVLGSIPDARRKEQFLAPYLESVRSAGHLSPDEKEKIILRNLSAYWYAPDQLAGFWRKEKASVTEIPLVSSDPDHNHRYHLVIQLPRENNREPSLEASHAGRSADDLHVA